VDPLGLPVRVELVRGTAEGSLTLAANGAFTYTPRAGFVGPDSFLYRVIAEGGRASAIVEAAITVTAAPPEPPQARDDAFRGRSDIEFPSLDVLANDTAGGSGGLRLLAVGAGSEGGSVRVDTATQRLLYAPRPGFSGDEAFTYTIVNDAGLQATARVVVTVDPAIPPNTPPTFTLAGDRLTVLESEPRVILPGFASGITAGEPGQTVRFEVAVDRPQLFAELPALDAEGTLTFLLRPGVAGDVVVTVIARDSGGNAGGGSDSSTPAQFVLRILPVNRPPSFVPGGNVTVNADAGAVTVLAWATSIQAGPDFESGQAVRFEIQVDQPTFFTELPVLSANGDLRFTVRPGSAGTALVRVVAIDDGGTANGGVDRTAPATFTLRVAGLPNVTGVVLGDAAPSPASNPVWVAQDAAPFQRMVSGTADGAPVTWTVLSGPAWFRIDPLTGAWSGTPRWGDTGGRVILRAATPTGGTSSVSLDVSVFRPSRTASAILPWPVERGWAPSRLPEPGRRVEVPASAAQQRGVRIVRVEAGASIWIAVGGVSTVQVFAAGADGVLGTADDVPVRVLRLERVPGGVRVVLDAAEPLGSTVRVELPDAL
jgi:hypothetical protein